MTRHSAESAVQGDELRPGRNASAPTTIMATSRKLQRCACSCDKKLYDDTTAEVALVT